MTKFNAFLRWSLMAWVIVFIGITLQLFGMFEAMYDADASKLSVLILLLFIMFTIQIGRLTYRKDRNQSVSHAQVHTCWFMADSMTTFGMVGTVIGFLIMLGTAFTRLDITEVASVQDTIQFMALGMSTALVTTLVGMTCGWILRMQLVNYENG